MGAAFTLLAADVWRKNAAVGMDTALGRLGVKAGPQNLLGHSIRVADFGEIVGTRIGVAVGAVLVVLLGLLWRDWIVASVALIAPLVSFVIIEHVAKPLINERIRYGGRTFPSGHTAGIAAVLTIAVLVVYRRWGGWAALGFTPVAGAVVTFVGLAVLRLDFHHYPTDIVGGAIFGAGTALAVSCAFVIVNQVLWPPATSGRRTLVTASS